MLVPVKAWKVQCDAPGCERETGDFGEYSFYDDAGSAEEDWDNSDGTWVDMLDNPQVRLHYCGEHIPVCTFETASGDCDGVSFVQDDVFYCDDHVPMED